MTALPCVLTFDLRLAPESPEFARPSILESKPKTDAAIVRRLRDGYSRGKGETCHYLICGIIASAGEIRSRVCAGEQGSEHKTTGESRSEQVNAAAESQSGENYSAYGEIAADFRGVGCAWAASAAQDASDNL